MTNGSRRAPPRVRAPKGEQQARMVWRATVGLFVGVAIAAGVLLATHSSPASPPARSVAAADLKAPSSLVKAANKVGFVPTTEPGVGLIEGQPASEASPPSNRSLLRVGTTAPGFRLRTPQGQRVNLQSLRGKTVLLEFFATWCPHCNAEAPHLRQLYSSLTKRRYAFVSVNADGEDAASVFAYHRYYGLRFPALLDPSSHPGTFSSPGSAGPVTMKYAVEDYPTFYILDTKGRVAWRSDGEQPDALIRRELTDAAARA